MCTEAFAFAPAAEICRDAVARGKDAGHGLSQTLGSILLAVARLGSGEPAAAERALREIDTRLARDGFAVEWQIRPRLELVRAEIALAHGALDDARARSEVLLELAATSGDRAHLALGRRVRALAALRAGARRPPGTVPRALPCCAAWPTRSAATRSFARPSWARPPCARSSSAARRLPGPQAGAGADTRCQRLLP